MMKKILFYLCLSAIFLLPTANAHQYQRDLPPGNYLESCRDCEMSHKGMLSCLCLDKHGTQRSTFVYPSPDCDYIENIDGNLQCTEHEYREHHPHHHKRADIEAGPIWDQRDAEYKCPRVCGDNHANWTGAWSTRGPGRSICECKFSHNHHEERPGTTIKVNLGAILK